MEEIQNRITRESRRVELKKILCERLDKLRRNLELYPRQVLYISEELTIPHGQSDHLSRRFRSLISERYSRGSKSFL